MDTSKYSKNALKASWLTLTSLILVLVAIIVAKLNVILAMIIIWIAILAIIILSIIAITSGIKALSEIKKDTKLEGKDLSVVAIIMSGLILLSFVFMMMLITQVS